MSIPTLIVGLGGTGALTVRALKHAYEQLPIAERVPAGFLAIDFDRSALVDAAGERLAELNEDEFLYLKPENIQDTLANLDRTLDDSPAWKSVHAWFPDRKEVQIPLSETEANGAGQFRALGRLGFFVHADRIEDTLRKRFEALPCEVNATTLSRRRRVILVASVAGGTGSGMLIDVAYLARRRLLGRPRVYAYLLLPEVFAEVDQGGRIYQNAYAALRELAHFKDQQIPFEGNYWKITPLSVPVGAEEPFTRLFLFGRQACPDGDPVVSSCREMADTVLAQLNATIQEKTLSIVANTASADVTEERDRRRTHCFSAAGSGHLGIGIKEIGQEVIVRYIAQVMRDNERLREVLAPTLGEMAERAENALVDRDQSGAVATMPTEDAEIAQQEALADISERAQRLARRFVKTIETVAADGRDKILDWLKSELEKATRGAAAEYEAMIEHAWGSIENLRNVLLHSGKDQEEEREVASADEASVAAEMGEKATKEQSLRQAVNALRDTMPPFDKVDRSIQRHVDNMLLMSQDVQDPRSRLVRLLFVSELRKALPHVFVWEANEEPHGELRRHWQDLDAKKEKLQSLPWFKRIFLSRQEKRLLSFGRAAVLQKARNLEALATTLKAVFMARANSLLKRRLHREEHKLGRQLEEVRRPWEVDLVDSGALPAEIPQLPPVLKEKIDQILRDRLRLLLLEAQAKIRTHDDDARRREVLRRLLREHVLDDPELRRLRFVVDADDDSKDNTKQQIISALAGSHQDIFVRRTPNPQRKGFGVILAPDGVMWPDGPERFRSFLDASAEQILECRSQVVTYSGKELWFYFEDLFNPPEHIRNLDDYYQAYASQAHPELFHIDRRLLDSRSFREIFSGSHQLVISCGNAGCSANLAYEERTLRICPGCHRPIRSRCGNAGCALEELHRHPRGKERRCPSCGGFNHAAWWRCDRHGKDSVTVPADKPRCPRCVARHHEDPVGFPESKISRRPDTEGMVECPNCARVREEDPTWDSFFVHDDLLPFYRNGVNGHERERFEELARERHKLPDGFRCKKCETMLIPVHHREMRGGRVS